MNKIVKRNWKKIKTKLKQTYVQLDNDDLVYIDGKEEELIPRLQKKLGKSKEDVRNLMNRVIMEISK